MQFNPRVSWRGGVKPYFFELVFAYGPKQLGVVGAGTYQGLYGANWALELNRSDNRLHLYQQANGGWQSIGDNLPPLFDEPMPAGAKRIALAFDLHARPVVVYELNERVLGHFWDGSSYLPIDLPGVDPCLLADATVRRGTTDADVLVIFLADSTLEVLGAAKSQGFLIPHTLKTSPVELILDQALPVAFRYQLLVQHGLSDDVLRSELFPVRLASEAAEVHVTGVRAGQYTAAAKSARPAHEELGVAATGVQTGELWNPKSSPDMPFEELGATVTGLQGGLYSLPVVEGELFEGAGASITGVFAGAHESVIVKPEMPFEGAGVEASGLVTGILKRVIVRPDMPFEEISSSITGIQGGVYEAGD